MFFCTSLLEKMFYVEQKNFIVVARSYTNQKKIHLFFFIHNGSCFYYRKQFQFKNVTATLLPHKFFCFHSYLLVLLIFFFCPNTDTEWQIYRMKIKFARIFLIVSRIASLWRIRFRCEQSRLSTVDGGARVIIVGLLDVRLVDEVVSNKKKIHRTG